MRLSKRQYWMLKRNGWRWPGRLRKARQRAQQGHAGPDDVALIRRMEGTDEMKAEARLYLRTKRVTTPCEVCLRYSRLRVGEKEPRRPIDWYHPKTGRRYPVDFLVERGAATTVIEARLAQLRALCSACARLHRVPAAASP